jgi:hypothetical protein
MSRRTTNYHKNCIPRNYDADPDFFEPLLLGVVPHNPDGGPLRLDVPAGLLDGKVLTEALLMLTPEQFAADIRYGQVVSMTARLYPDLWGGTQ